MIPLLIVIPCWSADIPQVRRLAKLMAGLQPTYASDTVHVMLAPRQDCPMDEEAISTLSQKFKTLRHQCNSPQRQYPGSVNGMFFSVFIALSMFQAQRYETVLWMEPDMTPLAPGWTDRLIGVWKARNPNIYAMGPIFSVDGTQGGLHLNGGSLWSPNILQVLPSLTVCDGAWDWSNRHQILPIAQSIQEIKYWHHARDVKFYPKGGPTCVIHGCKDDSLSNLVAADNGIVLDQSVAQPVAS